MSAAGAAMDADDPPSCSSSADPGGFEFAAKSAQLAREDARLQVEVRGRHLILVRRAGRVLAMDATCYHMGAPLLHGDIEDVPGHGACITCPWHHYQISMSTGERLYQDMELQTCTLPKKQRVHDVVEADGEVRVRLSGGGKPPSPPPGTNPPQPHELPKFEWESDRYAFKPPRRRNERAAAGSAGAGAGPRGACRGRGTSSEEPALGAGSASAGPGIRALGMDSTPVFAGAQWARWWRSR